MSKLIHPILEPVDYELNVPGSKSIALRHLAMSALANEPSSLEGVPDCDDVDAMIDCLRRLGTRIEHSNSSIVSVEPNIDASMDVELDCRQSGVSARLLLAIGALRTGKTSYIGHPSLSKRPNSALLDALTRLGCSITSDNGCFPITVQSPVRNSETVLDASLSSQFLTALLVMGRAMPNGIAIDVELSIASAPYVAGTINEMSKRGVTVKVEDRSTPRYVVESGEYSGGRVSIEGDASSATYHMAMATLHGGSVAIGNVGSSSWQADLKFANVCELIGAKVELRESSFTLRGPSKLRALPNGSVNMADMPDAALTLMAIAPYLPARTTITGLATLPYKECDRIRCPASELAKAGIRVVSGPDSISIWPGIPQPAEFDTYNDHRMAMALAVFASGAKNCRIKDPGCVNKTYTRFWQDFAKAYA